VLILPQSLHQALLNKTHTMESVPKMCFMTKLSEMFPTYIEKWTDEDQPLLSPILRKIILNP